MENPIKARAKVHYTASGTGDESSQMLFVRMSRVVYHGEDSKYCFDVRFFFEVVLILFCVSCALLKLLKRLKLMLPGD